jgi:excisionase family DNA binding protein
MEGCLPSSGFSLAWLPTSRMPPAPFLPGIRTTMNKSAPPGALVLLDIPAVARRLDISTKTVRRMIARGKVPVHRVGHLLRISECDLNKFIASCRSGHPQ